VTGLSTLCLARLPGAAQPARPGVARLLVASAVDKEHRRAAHSLRNPLSIVFFHHPRAMHMPLELGAPRALRRSPSSRTYRAGVPSSARPAAGTTGRASPQNFPCVPAASATSAADWAWGCCSLMGKWRNTKRTLRPRSCSTRLSSGNARRAERALEVRILHQRNGRVPGDPSTWSRAPTSAASRVGRCTGSFIQP